MPGVDWNINLGGQLARMSQRVAKRAGARGREDKARADSGAQAY